MAGIDLTLPAPVVRWQAGQCYGPPTSSVSASLGVNQRLGLAPIYVPAGAPALTQWSCEVTAAGNAGSTFTMAIFDDATGWPSALRAQSAALDATVVGVKDIALSLSLPPGWYWVGGLILGAATTAPTMRMNNASTVAGLMMSGSSAVALQNGNVSGAVQSGASAMPSTFGAGPGNVSAGFIPRVALRT